jgi:nucleoside phosphorylase
MIGVVFTTTEEAAPFVQHYRDGRFSDLTADSPLHDDRVLVSVSGTGKIRAALHTERLCRNHGLSQLLHVGMCTALADSFEIGMLVGATAVLEGDRIELSSPSYPQMPLETPFDTDAEGTLVTQDHVIQEPEERSYWQRIADINDSSGYALAYVAAQHGVPCHIAKVITARAGEDNASFQQDRKEARTRISDWLRSYLEDAVEEAD